ncbi:cupin domain-containing protein [Rhizobium sp. NLR22b]|uniref:cupin domain-containing protein n=1 Tax=Rhizobium sp. NLR22b TaxID=2731115 RepID=UPI001C832550|nr:cupin domain-containing protein [Rhizobium sp. NLR22b]MBX5239076.1 cupin domain-containing protein [Rhizobium sp. NLR22b]
MNVAGRISRTITWLGTAYTINVGRIESGGIVGVFESTVPAGGGPPVHMHHNEDEVIHVIEGAYEFWLNGAIIPVAASRSIFLPRGVPHTFRVASASPGRNLTVLTPGGLEEFFIEAAVQAPRLPEHMDRLLQLAGRYGIEFRGPPDWDTARAS